MMILESLKPLEEACGNVYEKNYEILIRKLDSTISLGDVVGSPPSKRARIESSINDSPKIPSIQRLVEREGVMNSPSIQGSSEDDSIPDFSIGSTDPSLIREYIPSIHLNPENQEADNRHQISPVNAQREFCDVAKAVLLIVTGNTSPETSSIVISIDGNATMEASIHESEEVILQAGDQELVKSIDLPETPNCKPRKYVFLFFSNF
ncbi:hypothetical protein B9Z55_015440 [Caenorhabditis nigoni]|uniref:Uncharacterized protein n=1 Tax=Caenorhabditis nigoni TaxID=1611254 RepID=A0A2G5UA99_9PELO|nr:hypothetical protein B9Z55_015440 [Caenorhabditis nigoni]